MADQDSTSSNSGARRYRPGKRVAASQGPVPAVLTEEYIGVAAAFGNTLLFVGYEVDGLVEIVVYPRYRFSSDDRVQGYLGYLWVPLGTPWETVLEQVDAIYNKAQENYRLAVSLRMSEMRAHGSRFESAYDTICEVFRESWHGFSLKLRREGRATKGNIEFTGRPPEPVLAIFEGRTYTVHVFPSGSITMLNGDQRKRLR